MKLREFVRIPVQCPVECISKDFFADGLAINLSMGGLAIASNHPPGPGVNIKLRVFLPDDQEPILIKQAIVQWAEASQFGVRVMAMGEFERRRLNQFVLNRINKSSLRWNPVIEL